MSDTGVTSVQSTAKEHSNVAVVQKLKLKADILKPLNEYIKSWKHFNK